MNTSDQDLQELRQILGDSPAAKLLVELEYLREKVKEQDCTIRFMRDRIEYPKDKISDKDNTCTRYPNTYPS